MTNALPATALGTEPARMLANIPASVRSIDDLAIAVSIFHEGDGLSLAVL